MTKDELYAELLKRVHALPPMTEEEKIEQRISFGWSNAAVEWPDPRPIPFEKFRADMWRDEWRKLQTKLAELQRPDNYVASHQTTEKGRR